MSLYFGVILRAHTLGILVTFQPKLEYILHIALWSLWGRRRHKARVFLAISLLFDKISSLIYVNMLP